MSEIADTISEAVEKAGGSRINTIVAVSVAITATFIALCNVKDGNIVQAMAQEQASGVDAWAYYQVEEHQGEHRAVGAGSAGAAARSGRRARRRRRAR